MNYADEKIAAMLREAEKLKAPKDIRTGPVRIGSRFYEFEERLFFDDTLSLYLPSGFEEMPEAHRKLKYPSSERPEIIQTDETGGINMTLNRVDNDLSEEWVKDLTDGMKLMMKKLNPAHVFYADGVEQVEGKQIGYFEFKSSAIDGFIYNLMLFLEWQGKTVMGTFSCLYSDYADWREIAFQMLQTIRVVRKEAEAG